MSDTARSATLLRTGTCVGGGRCPPAACGKDAAAAALFSGWGDRAQSLPPLVDGDRLAEIAIDEPPPHFQQSFHKRWLVPFVGGGIGHAFHDNAEQFGDRIADRLLADGDDELAGIFAVDQLLERRLSAD